MDDEASSERREKSGKSSKQVQSGRLAALREKLMDEGREEKRKERDETREYIAVDRHDSSLKATGNRRKNIHMAIRRWRSR